MDSTGGFCLTGNQWICQTVIVVCAGVMNQSMREQKFLIGGEWTSSSNTVTIRNPYRQTAIASLHLAENTQVESALQSALSAYQVTSRYTSFERADILRSIVNQLTKRKEEFAQSITEEAGKPISFSRSEVDRAIATFDIAAEETKRIEGETIPLDLAKGGIGRRGIINYFPIGVILCITPFNFPLNLVAHKIAPAIATGNAFILKPPPQAPLTSLLLGEVLLNSGIDPKTINIIPTSNAVAEQLVSDERIAMLNFTGSAVVGWMLKGKAGKKKVILELGGNAAAIINKDADLTHAVNRCVLGAFGYAGQVCIKVQRMLVHESVADDFEKKFVEATLHVFTGDPANEKTVVGPMISEQEALRVESWVAEAVSNGATLLAGGKRTSNIYSPTVLKNVRSEMKVCSEEVFGPVVTIEKFSTIEEAVEKVNHSRYGLQAGLFTNDFSAIQYCYQQLHVGGLIINDFPTFRVDNMPYGGVKDSGFGREGVRYAMKEMMEKKLLVM